ncbi:hypothetical protein [[Phormidium] sp. ETS-05]|nr:hypothetical protein [[Phormidium] sp. ETS-05]
MGAIGRQSFILVDDLSSIYNLLFGGWAVWLRAIGEAPTDAHP